MKTKRFILTYLSITLFSMFSIAQLKIDHERYKKLLNDGKYETLIEETMKIRSSSEYGKNWIIDYYIALGFCGAGKIDASNKGFNYIIKEYPDNVKMSNLINESRNKCNNTVSTFNFNDLKNLFSSNNWQGGGSEPSVVKGKLGYVLNCNKDIELYEFNPNFNQEELQKRLFQIDEVDSAVIYYKNYLPTNKYNIYASGRFIFITPLNSSLSDNKIKNITDELEKTYAFYVDYYSLRPPDKLITVYLMGSSERLAEVALETHGLKIPNNNYGYSCLADLSVLGNSSASGLGTIRHELFHIIVRTDLGDIPGWLDEGIACLYEESHWENNKLVCNNIVWRTKVIQLNNKVKNPLPSIRAIIENNWGEFTPSSAKTICELSVNYAMAKHFMMYLDEKNMLPALVDSYKNRKNVFVNSSYSNESSISILQNTLGDLSQIQKEFDLWLSNNYNIKTARDPYGLKKRVDEVYGILKMQCSNDKDVIDMNNEFESIMEKLNEPKIVVQGELLDRCVKFIFKAEELAMRCTEWF